MMDVINYDAKYMDTWDNFVHNSRNGTLFHTQKFLSYHKNKFTDSSLIFKYKGDVVGVLPAVYIDGHLFSHAGSSFGGVVLHKNIGLGMAYSIIDKLLNYCSDNKITKISMRLPPYIYHKMPCDELDFSLSASNFIVAGYDLSCVITLDSSIIINDSTARSIRKASNSGLWVNYDSVEGEKYWCILESNLDEKHSVHPTHTLEEILRLKNMFPDKIKLVTCYLKDKMVCGVVLFVGNENAFEVFYIAQDYEFQEHRALNLVLHNVISWGFINRFKYMNLGISTEDRGKKVNWGLFKFKEGFGSHSVLRRTYRKEL